MATLVVIILAVIFLSASVRVVKDHERMAVFGLGRFLRVLGPGLVFLIPVVDKGVRVNLSEKIPGWQALSKEELGQKVTDYVIGESGSGG